MNILIYLNKGENMKNKDKQYIEYLIDDYINNLQYRDHK